MKKNIKRVLMTLVFGTLTIIVASIISFLISQVLPGDPVLAYHPPGPINQAIYDQLSHQLGFDQPFLIQLLRYIGDMITGQWGLSITVLSGVPAFSLILDRIPSTLFLLLIPLILGFVLGFILGNYSTKFNTRTGERVVRILSLVGFVIPIILLMLSFQFFPINNLVFLWITLTISHMTLTIILARIYLKKLSRDASEKRSNILFVLLVGVSYGILYTFFIQIEIMFSFGGIGELLLQAFSSADYYVINGIIFIILFSAPIFIILSLFSFFLFGKIRKRLTGK